MTIFLMCDLAKVLIYNCSSFDIGKVYTRKVIKKDIKV